MEAREYWKKHEACVSYNSNFKRGKDYYKMVRVCNDFYNGDQWVGMEEDGLPHPVFNISKRVVQFKIASITSTDIAVNVEPLEYTPHNGEELFDSDFINAEIKNVFEKWNFRSIKKDVLRRGAISGDMCFHLLFNPSKKPFRGSNPDVKGEMEIEVIDATNVEFGNANIIDTQKQPFIILVGRDTVKNLKAEAKEHADEIKPDSDTENSLTDFADTEVDIEGDENGKAKYIYFYEKEDGKVYVTKCTQDAIIYEHIDTGLTYYPIAFRPWDVQDNTYHGRGEIEGLSVNNIIINKMFAMIVYHQTTSAFPPALFDGDVLEEWSNEIGTAFKLEGLNGRSIRDVAGYLEPANMSDSIIKVIDLAMQYTKECMGVSDASLGNIDPKNTSAIIAVQKSTAVPLENIRDNLYNLVEQLVTIMLDMMATKYGTRPVVITDENGGRKLETYDFSKLKDMDLHLGIDVGEGSYFSEISAMQTLDNLLQGQYIEFIDYLERMPKDSFPRVSELIAKVKEKQQVNSSGQYEQMAQFMEQLPPEQQERLQSLPPEQLEATIKQMMGI